MAKLKHTFRGTVQVQFSPGPSGASYHFFPYHFDVSKSKAGTSFCEELSTLRSPGRFAAAYNPGRDCSPSQQNQPLAPANRSEIVSGCGGPAGNRLWCGLLRVSISSGNEASALRQRNRRTLLRSGAQRREGRDYF